MNALALAGLAQRLGLRVAVGCRALVRLPQCEAAAARQERRYSSGKLDEFSDEVNGCSAAAAGAAAATAACRAGRMFGHRGSLLG